MGRRGSGRIVRKGAFVAKTTQDRQRALHHYRQVTGIDEVDMHEFARFAVEKLGWPLPEPIDPLDRLARQMARAAREETKTDANTGRPYRVNHAIPNETDGQTRFSWAHIDRAPRPRMQLALRHRREQMVGDATMLVYDADHWNSIHPDEPPIQIELDFGPDVEWRKNSDDEDDAV